MSVTIYPWSVDGKIPYLIMNNSNPTPEIRVIKWNSPKNPIPVYINPLIMPVWDNKGVDLPRLPYFPFSGEDQSYSDYLSLISCTIVETTKNTISSEF